MTFAKGFAKNSVSLLATIFIFTLSNAVHYGAAVTLNFTPETMLRMCPGDQWMRSRRRAAAARDTLRAI
jgi:hypothetical protein